MSRWWRKLASEMKLIDAELGYLSEAYTESKGIPKHARRQLGQELAEQLSERPSTDRRFDINAALGSPPIFVLAFRAAHGIAASMSPWSRWLAKPRRVRWAQLAAIVLIGVAVMSGYSYFTSVPQFSNSCGGVRATDVEVFQAGGTSEYRATFHQDERFGLFVCIQSSNPGAVVEAVRGPLASRLAIQPVGMEVNRAAFGSFTLAGDASAHEPFEPHVDPRPSVVWYEWEYCNLAAGTISFDMIFVDYEYRWRSRTVQISLGYTAALDGGEQCTDTVRTKTEAESFAWEDVTRAQLRRLKPTGPVGPLGPLHLYPEAVSRDLCRYLRGIIPVRDSRGRDLDSDFEPLEARAVFQLNDTKIAEVLIDGAVLGICPQFADRRDELVALLSFGDSPEM